MYLNVNKCYKITFNKINAPIQFDYSINNSSLHSKNDIRDLGITFDSKLLFNLHVNNICSKSLKMLGFVKRLSSDFSANSFKILYCSLVRSVLEFASPVWSPCYACHIDRIENVQHKFLRHWSFKMGYYHDEYVYNDLLLILNMQTLEQRRFLADMCIFYKILNNQINCPQLLRLISLNAAERRTRNTEVFLVPFHSTNYGKNEPCTRFLRQANECVSLDFFSSTLYQCKNQMKQLLNSNLVN